MDTLIKMLAVLYQELGGEAPVFPDLETATDEIGDHYAEEGLPVCLTPEEKETLRRDLKDLNDYLKSPDGSADPETLRTLRGIIDSILADM